MDKGKHTKLERAGWKTGSAKEFLGLSDEEAAFVECKLALSTTLRERRRRSNLSQTDLARRLGSSQSRVAKMEAADASVSVDLLLRSVIALGATPRDIARVLGHPPHQPAQGPRAEG